jgi:VIT1/CCC1 family predicted Fe2+/Mn2+ transporter
LLLALPFSVDLHCHSFQLAFLMGGDGFFTLALNAATGKEVSTRSAMDAATASMALRTRARSLLIARRVIGLIFVDLGIRSLSRMRDDTG